MSWRNLAAELYYSEGFKIVEIAEEVKKSKQAISKFLSNEDPERYIKEKEKRKEESKEREKTRKRNWKRENHESAAMDIDYILLKQQHERDVAFLSGNVSSVMGLYNAGYLKSAYQRKNGRLERKDTTTCGAVIPKSLPKIIRE